MAEIKPGTMLPFWLGMPSVKAGVLGISQDGQYVLVQEYDTVNMQTGERVHVERTYYRDRYFIEGMCISEKAIIKKADETLLTGNNFIFTLHEDHNLVEK